MNGTTTGRLSSSEPHMQELPPRDPLAAALGRLQRAGACVMALPQPTKLRDALAARSTADAQALRERLLGLDYRALEERVLAWGCEEAAPVSPEAWARLGRCPWDAWKPGRDVA